MARPDRIPVDAPKLPPATALRTLARVGRFVRPYLRQVTLAAIALLVAAGAVLAIGQGLKFVIDRGFVAGSAGELDRALALLGVVIAVMAVATFTRFYYVSWLGERVTVDLRRAVFDHLLTLPPGFFEVTRTGEVISRLTNDTTMLETVIGSSVSMAVRNLLLLVSGLVMLALLDSDIVIGWLRGDRSVVRALEALEDSRVRTYCTPVTWAEVWAGVRRGEEHVTDAFLQARGTLPLDGAVGRRAGEYLQRFSRSHAVELADALIAAAASLHTFALWTRNRKHYPMTDLRFYAAS